MVGVGAATKFSIQRARKEADADDYFANAILITLVISVIFMVVGILGAEKLILLTDIRGLLRDPKDEETLINVVHTYDVPKLIEEGVISGGMIPKMECCVDAIHGGVDRVHILDGRIPHSILIELLSDRGIGTMLRRESD